MMKNPIMCVDRALGFWFWAALRATRSGQNRLDDFFSEQRQCSNGLQVFRDNFISARPLRFVHDVFAPKFLQIIGRFAGCIRAALRSADRCHFDSKIRDCKSPGSSGQLDDPFDHGPHPRFVDIHPSDAHPTHPGGAWPLVQSRLPDAGDVDTTHRIQKPVQDPREPLDDLGEPLQRVPAKQRAGVVNDDLDTKDAFAFGIELGGDSPKMNLGHRHVIRRSLDHDLLSMDVLACTLAGTLFGSQDGPKLLYVQLRARPVDHPLKYLFQFAPSGKEQVARILPLVDGVSIPEAGLLLCGQIQRKTETGRVDPTLTDPAQPPYDALSEQGVCDFCQACSVGNLGETVSILAKSNPFPYRFSGDILMAVQDNLSRKRGMTAHLDGQMSSLGVNDVERIVVHVRQGRFPCDVLDGAALPSLDLPDRSRRPAHQDEEHPHKIRIFGKVLLGQFMFAFSTLTVENRDAMGACISTKPPAEATRHAHQMRVIQMLIGSIMQASPPGAKSCRGLSQPEVGVEHNPIHTVIGSIHQGRIVLAERIGIVLPIFGIGIAQQ